VEGLYLRLDSFADMTMDRAVAIARAFDAHPYLRPLKVGGDPARIKVEPTMEALVVKQGLPIEWLTVRLNARFPDFELGQIELYTGRGGWIGSRRGGEWEYSLAGHDVEQHWLAATMSEPAAVDEAAALFEELVIAADAAYACAASDTWKIFNGSIKFGLPGVFWLNYFGPAFLTARPRLATIGGARTLPTGGVLVRTTVLPWQPAEDGTPASELRAILGEQAFQRVQDNPSVPSAEEHVAASPGTTEMPWVAWLAAKATTDRATKHASARRRLATALEGRREPVLGADAVEWSTSFDLPDWQDFARYLTRKLRGDFSTALGRAAIAVITTAPVEQEDSLLLATELGTIRLGWFIDDEDVVDAYIFGPGSVRDLCQKWFE
jgi:hypothetical protein